MRLKSSLMRRLTGWGCVMALIVLGVSYYSGYRLGMIQLYADRSYKDVMIPLHENAQFVMTFSNVQNMISEHIAASETERMDHIEVEMGNQLKTAASLLKHMGSGSDQEQMKKQWESVTQLIWDTVNQSKAFNKFEALKIINGGEGLQKILALNKGISKLLTEKIKRAEEYQRSSIALGYSTRKHMIGSGLAAFILSIIIGLFLARSIGRPVRALADVAGRISEGDLRGEIAIESRTDEIGTLGETFQRMVTSMRNQTAKVDEIVKELSEVASTLSTTMSQQVQLSTNTSSAVSEVTATVAQVRRSAQITNDKAKNVADISQDALRISDSAKNSTQMTADKMNLIRNQMQSIGETVVKLSDQSQAIDNIVVSVQDLTDQSNLLAVNASIEAARAGEHGKGFAVVSHEIKMLADESKNATVQIRTILDDISKWVSAVVMATEQGIKAVDLGVEQSALAGESIKSLVDGVADSAQAASAISAASQDQLGGMDQATDAMEVIETTMQQNLDTTSQLESAAKKLQGLGETLTELVKYYKV